MTPLFATSPGEGMVQAVTLSLLLAVSAAVGTWIIIRWQHGSPIIPLARRRPVPWQAPEVLFLFLIGLLFLPWVVQERLGPDAEQQPAEAKPELAHSAEQLLRTGAPGEKAIAVLMVVIVAPWFEEFFFRVLLQGWLEAVWSHRRRQHRELRAAPASWIPIVLPAVLFALMHRRSSEIPHSPHYLTQQFLAYMASSLLALGLAVAVLRFATRATPADLGWQPEKLRSDAQLGLLALLLATGPVLAIQTVLAVLVKLKGIDYAPDPIPLFFLALVFGVLYRRTHRIAPSLILHMAFNATSVAGLLFAGQ